MLVRLSLLWVREARARARALRSQAASMRLTGGAAPTAEAKEEDRDEEAQELSGRGTIHLRRPGLEEGLQAVGSMAFEQLTCSLVPPPYMAACRGGAAEAGGEEQEAGGEEEARQAEEEGAGAEGGGAGAAGGGSGEQEQRPGAYAIRVYIYRGAYYTKRL